ncbi:MAG TPA: helix-turn-helix transcriptional regulator [Stellaceae bacterium]|nr:helix-turn-helix transcriptional regulator [Stellaceae bacterium]
MSAAKKHHPVSPIGSSFEAFLQEQGILEETTEHAIKAVLAWQLAQEMKRRKMTKTVMAKRLATSRSQLDRLLDPNSEAVTLATLKKAAALIGKKVRLELVDIA